MNVCDEVCNLFFKEMEVLFNIFVGVFVTVVNDSVVVVVIRAFICIVAMGLLCFGIMGGTTR